MKKLSVLISLMIAKICCSQIQLLNSSNLTSSQFTVINTGTTDYLLSISKINNNLLICGYSSYLAKSYDDCNTLIPVNTPVFLESPQNRYYKIFRVDTNYLYMSYKTNSNNWKFFKSVDGGNNWVKKKDSTHSNLSFVEPPLLFYDTINASIIFSYNTALYTNNSLSTYSVGSWQPALTMGVAVNIGTVISDSMAIFGENIYGGTYVTKDRGKTWQGNGIGGRARDFEVINKDTVYGIGSPVPPGSVAFFGYTFDGGLTWPYNFITSHKYLMAIAVKSKSEIYVTAREPSNFNGPCVILKTTDLGQTWSKFTTPFTQELRDMKFLNDSVALICGDSGLLVKWNTKQSFFVGVKENSISSISVNIYANPLSEKVIIEIPSQVILNASVINSIGQIVSEVTLHSQTTEISTNDLPCGIYYVRVSDGQSQKTFKFVKTGM